ncbi:helix-turn-helix domain-containing protein [Methanolobus mangrovi]|uniref:Helix-turn-helix domain-containing protein n=1 Tax=Methanolobus mangrovi TaxID=3072977 RepID=A0AA51UER3_9EURY|nr:helix-turn-helix domain-containing protein [Methanolobus mangrovi]WMW21869.1 helix-turn-helix domain-containing protein [Methanolobus mangrovi]
MGDNDESTYSEKVLIVPLNEDSKKITQILSNEKAMKMLEILADKPMSASDVAEKLDIPLTTVKYNLDGLIEVDLIKVRETKWSRKGREIKIYEPVQKLIVVAPGGMKNDRSSIISMLKKYLGLIAGAVFAATGLEAITRSFSLGAGPSIAQDTATAPMFDEEPMAFMAKDIAPEFETPEVEVENFAGAEMPVDDSAMGVAVDEQTVSADITDYDVPTESFSSDSLPVDGASPEILAASAPNGTDAGADLLREGIIPNATNQTHAIPASNTFTDNMTAMAEPASGIFQQGILSHVSIWFFFGCIFVIALLFVREMYYRKKNI